ncbi:hypothetical protein D046_5815B, partial [Vibrio parahaemolyticus V-223/04]
RTCSRPKS